MKSEFIQWILEGLHGIKDAIMGSLIFSLYSFFYLKRTFLKSVLSFFTGTVFSIYLTPQIVYFFPNINSGLIGFLSGMLGMTMVELAVKYNYEELIERIVAVYWTKKSKTEDDKGESPKDK